MNQSTLLCGGNRSNAVIELAGPEDSEHGAISETGRLDLPTSRRPTVELADAEPLVRKIICFRRHHLYGRQKRVTASPEETLPTMCSQSHQLVTDDIISDDYLIVKCDL